MRYSMILLALVGLLAACSSGEMRTPKGYLYEVLEKGSGTPAEVGQYAQFQFVIRAGENDSVFYDSHLETDIPLIELMDPDSVPAGQVYPFVDILTELVVGDSVRVYESLDTIQNKPPALADIDEFRYDVTLVNVLNEEEFQAELDRFKQQQLAQRMEAILAAPGGSFALENIQNVIAGGSTDEVKEMPSGLKIVIHEKGTGAKAVNDQNISVNYLGMLTEDGTIFDESYTRGQPITFPLGQGQVIKGWDEGLAELRVGDKATFIIPAELGYGAMGSQGGIPPNAELAFFVEVVNVGE